MKSLFQLACHVTDPDAARAVCGGVPGCAGFDSLIAR